MTEPTSIRQHRRYTKRQKATAIIAAEVSSVMAAAEQTGIPSRTIRHWRDDPRLASFALKTREEVADGFKVLTGLAIDRLTELIPTMDARDLTILAGVAVDKGQLLSGGPTSRSESRDITGTLTETEQDTLAGILRDAVESNAGD